METAKLIALFIITLCITGTNVVAEFNFDITSMMLELAKEHAKFLDAEITEVFPVPGVYDMPIAIKKLLDEGKLMQLLL